MARPIATPIAVTAVSPTNAPAATGRGRCFVESEMTKNCVLSPSSITEIRRNAAAKGAIPSIEHPMRPPRLTVVNHGSRTAGKIRATVRANSLKRRMSRALRHEFREFSTISLSLFSGSRTVPIIFIPCAHLALRDGRTPKSVAHFVRIGPPSQRAAHSRAICGDGRMVDVESDAEKKSVDDVREEFEEKIDRLRRQYERDLHSFRYEIEEREYRLKAYEDKFNKIKQPPLLYAYIVRKEGPDLDGSQVVVARATELLKVSTGLVDKTSLGLGQYVWVHPQTYAIVEGSATHNSGVIAKVMDILDGRLVVSIEGDMEKRLVECEKSMMKKLTSGSQYSVLPPTMELLEVLPNLEVKSLLLGEKPNVTYAMIGGLSEPIDRIRDVVVLPFQEAKLFEQIKLEIGRAS